MEGAWPASPAATRAAAATRSPEPGGQAQDGSAGRRWSGQLLIGHDGKLLRRPAAAEKGEWPRRGQGPGLLGEPGGGRGSPCPGLHRIES